MRHIFSLILTCLFILTAFTILHAQVVINEYSVSNLNTIPDNYNEYPDWLELYNTSSSMVSLEGYYLSDDPGDPTKWQFPAGVTISANGFKKIWLSGRNEVVGNNIHTNFKLTQTKAPLESILLADPSGAILEQHLLTITQLSHSNGRTTNGAATWSVFTNPTFGTSNNTATPYQRYTAKPSMNKTAGFYPSSIVVTITNNEPNSTLRYTIDGTEVKNSSTAVTGPITISSTTLLKARAFSSSPNILPGLIEFNTYLINENTTLPVMSFGADQLTTLLNGNGWINPEGSMEYFNKNKVRTTIGYGEFDKHGQDSWAHDQRSLDVRQRDEFGYNYSFQEKFFKTSERDEFQRLIIRACGDDNYPGIDTSAHTRDDFVESLSEYSGQHLDWRKSERCLVFANGQYWGVYSIREKVDDADYCEFYYGQDRYNLQFIMLWGSIWAEYGGQQALDDYDALYDYIMSHDMSDPGNYAFVSQQYDITSLSDYMIINSYVVCSDWLNWNVGWWRGMDSSGTHKKWGYILWDEDATFGHYINYTGIPAQSPYVSPCFHENLPPSSDPGGHVAVLNKLRENETFNQYYINRYVDLLNTTFKPSYAIPFLDSMATIIAPEMPRHFTRWGGNLNQWENNVEKIKNFIDTRYSIINSGLMSCYSLTGPYNLNVTVDPPGAGQVKVNSLVLDDYPWTGQYFGGIDLRFQAIESNEEYIFDHWAMYNHTLQPSATSPVAYTELTTADQLIAIFVPKTMDDSLVINEINYHSASTFDPGDWVELYNPQPYTVDVADWYFKDENDLHSFVFPQGTSMPAHGYLVLVEDVTKFTTLFPTVSNFIGPLGFGLSGNGELIRLYNEQGFLVDTVHYDDVPPWPIEPDGQGPTLELINPAYDNALAESWHASYTAHGTPGEQNSVYVSIPEPIKPFGNVYIVAYPNPVRQACTINIIGEKKVTDGEIILYNQLGTEVRRLSHISSETVHLTREGLPSGIYMIRYTDQQRNVYGTARVVLE